MSDSSAAIQSSQGIKDRFTNWLVRIGPGGVIIRVFLLWFICALILFPNINTIINVFFQNGEFTTNAFRKLMSSQRAIRGLVNTVVLGLSMAVTVNIVGTLIVLIVDYFKVRGARILNVIFHSTLVYQGIVLCTGYRFVYGANGIITALLLKIFPNMNPSWFTGYGAVLFVMTFACTSNHILFFRNALRSIDYQTVEAAKNMGASQATIFRKVIFPVLKPNYMALTVLTFVVGITSTSASLILGGENFEILNPIIISFAKTAISKDIATLLAVVLGICTFILLSVCNRLERGGNYISVSKVKTRVAKEQLSSPALNGVLHFVAYLFGVIYAMPIVMVILYSFTDGMTIVSGSLSMSSFTFQNYRNLLSVAGNLRPYLISLSYSVIAGVLVTLLVTLVSRVLQRSGGGRLSRALDGLMTIPWFLPSTLIALGLMVTYDRPQLLMAGNVLIGTPAILCLSYIIMRLPISLRMIKASFFSLDHALEESAQSMGARSSYTFFRVLLPILFPTMVAVVMLNFVNIIVEYDMTVFLYHPLYEPISTVIRAANDETASVNAISMVFVYSVLLMIICSIALMASNLVQRFATRYERRGSKA